MSELIKISNSDREQWSSWTKLKNEYIKSTRKIKKYIAKEKNKSNICKANLEIAGSIISDLDFMIKDLEKKCLYEYNTMSQEDISNCNLTERQKQIAMLRQKNSISNISKMLNLEPSTVYLTYKEALRKIDRYLKLEKEEKQLNLLSEQQKKIFLMKRQGMADKEIITNLGITINSLKTQKRRIREKLGVTKI